MARNFVLEKLQKIKFMNNFKTLVLIKLLYQSENYSNISNNVYFISRL